MIKAHKAIPDVVSGYELNKLQFSVIVPIERTNLITNPSFETNTTGYTSVDGATLTRTTETQRRGVYSLRIKPGVSSVSGVYYTSSALTAGQTYAFSLDVFIRGGKKFQIRAFDGIRTLVTRPIIGKNYWERVSFIFTAVTTGAHRFYFEKNGESSNAFTDNVFTDGWQLELCEAGNYFETTYIDGDQQGLIANQVPPAYVWNGTPNASTSTRSSQTRSGGRVMSLQSFGFRLMSIIGLGISSVINTINPYGLLDGGQYQRSKIQSQSFTLIGEMESQSKIELNINRARLLDTINPNLTSLDQPLVLQCFDDPERGGTGKLVYINCLYSGGLEGNFNSYYQERVGIKFVSPLPYVISEDGSGASLGFALDVANTNSFATRDRNGNWTALGTGVTAGLIEQIVVAPDGIVYVGGGFTSAGGVASTSRIASYNPATNTWSPLGIGANGSVVSLAVGPDGSIYAGGDFTLMDGVANTVRIAKWNPSTRTWTSLSTGANGSVRAMTFGIDGNLYVAGDFSTIGGVSASRIAVWNGTAWAALGTGLTGGSQVGRILVTGPDGNLYVGGTFTAAGGVTAGSIAKYNPLTATWNALGTGTTDSVFGLAFGLDGTLYAAGDFTIMGGISTTLAAKWNGIAWSPLGSGFDTTTVLRQLNVVAVDDNGLVYFAGRFSTANGLSFSNVTRIAVWNGSSFNYLDIRTPQNNINVNEIVFDQTGKLYLGFSGTGTSTATYINTIINNGGQQVYPTIRFNGPGTIFQIKNYTTGKYISFNLTLISGEIATLVLMPGSVSFTSNLRGNLLSTVLPGSNLADFSLLQGNNLIALLIIGAGANTQATIEWKDTYPGLDRIVRQ